MLLDIKSDSTRGVQLSQNRPILKKPRIAKQESRATKTLVLFPDSFRNHPFGKGGDVISYERNQFFFKVDLFKKI